MQDLLHIEPGSAAVCRLDPMGTLHRHDPDACCAIRKVEPLIRALLGFSAWISGRMAALLLS